MDGARFDHLSRRFAGACTRRQALKAIAGAMVATVAGTRGTAAQDCSATYSSCQSDDQCCAGAVCEHGLCMPGCRIDGAFVNAWGMPPGDICQQCLSDLSTTAWSPANEGMSCWSGDPNAGATFCQAGVCAPTGYANCPPPSPCHTDELLDPATCAYAVAEAGTPCGNGPMCHGDFYQPADTCNGNGFCIGGGSQTVPCAPYICGDGACTSSCQTDNDCAGGAHCDDGLCFPDEDLGNPCDEDSDCRSGICVDGTCCNQRCEGMCEVCSAETGGYCSPVICDDGLACTSGVCDQTSGACAHTINPSACLIEGACVSSGVVNSANACQVCDPAVSQAAWSLAPAGTVCDEAVSCLDGVLTEGASCDVTGACVPVTAPCPAVDACTPGACAGDGLACNQASACSGNTTCDGGACVPSTCLELGDDCETADQCCGEGQTCGPRVENLSETECCFELGAAGCTGSGSGDCCAYTFPSGGGDSVSCAGGICGGAGARCNPNLGEVTCASGTCCSNQLTPLLGSCCAENEACVAFECVPM